MSTDSDGVLEQLACWGRGAAATAVAHRPQALVFGFTGQLVVDKDLPAIPSSTFLRVLGSLGVAEGAARATLSRMTRRGLLHREQAGRTARYSLTPSAAELLRRGRRRVLSEAPFDHPEGEWTLLSYSVPESRRDLRHRLRATLTWAGFGGLRDGLWIAPGTVDVAQVLAEAELTEAAGVADWFAASPLPGTRVEELLRRAWPIATIRRRHEDFIARWSDDGGPDDVIARLTLLGADWLLLLRTDPGLPAAHLDPDWPARRSAGVYRRRLTEWEPLATRALELELGGPLERLS